MTALGYRLMTKPAFEGIQALTHEEFSELQRECEFNRVFPQWKRLGKRLLESKRVNAHRVAKPA
jgi:hypothetical protein